MLDTTGLFIGRLMKENRLKDIAMLKRLNCISTFHDKNEHILYTIDRLIKSAKLQAL